MRGALTSSMEQPMTTAINSTRVGLVLITAAATWLAATPTWANATDVAGQCGVLMTTISEDLSSRRAVVEASATGSTRSPNPSVSTSVRCYLKEDPSAAVGVSTPGPAAAAVGVIEYPVATAPELCLVASTDLLNGSRVTTPPRCVPLEDLRRP